ncbi:hypothetical protein FVEN_g7816 [Fusarium venenatum]|uniref:uncharacterized protein n=1 Tax=Fusarium venenatum TaxID=56646 RepID=UPI001D87FCC9|nr:hypothetical protein FVEN_g7816 [Fusarium venenatum]KAH6964773.1 hypothetical protein EDB82DRAFT_479164 [Fusarium venenatum]
MSPRATPAVAWRAVRTTFTVIFSPWYLSHRSMVQLLNSADSDNNSETGTQLSTRDTMTGWWIERKIAELSFVGLTCALLAGVVAAAFSWQDLKDLSWPTKGLWYGSLIIDLTSICLATQQSLTLHRLSCYTNKCERVREMLSKSSSYQAHPSEAEVTQLYVWQTPIMLLNIGIVLFIIGLAIQIITDLSSTWSPADVKAFVLVMIATIFAASVYMSSSILLYSRIKDS